MSAEQTSSTTIPLTVLTGFLGSGKTTLLKRLLDNPAMAGTAVIINEFGDVGLDDRLVEKVDEDAILLPSGCVCCTVRGDLTRVLTKLFTQHLGKEIPPIKRVVLETTGLADPSPIAHTLMTDEDIFRIYQLDGIVTTVDGQLGLGQLDTQFEPAKQIAIADRIIITKTDIAAPADIARLEARLRALNPSAEILRVIKGDIAPKHLVGLGAHEPAIAGADPIAWLGADPKPKRDTIQLSADESDHVCGPGCGHDHHHHDHAAHGEAGHAPHGEAGHNCGPNCDHNHDDAGHLHGIKSFSLTFDKPLDGNALSIALQTMASAYGDKLLRVKGIVSVENQELPFVVHGVQHIFYPPDVLREWPKNADGTHDKRSRFVVIARDLDPAIIKRHLKPFLGDPIV